MQLKTIITLYCFAMLTTACVAKVEGQEVNEDSEVMFVVFDFYNQSKKDVLTAEFIEKKKEGDKIVFSRGIDSSGFVDYFIAVSGKSKQNIKVKKDKIISLNDLCEKENRIILIEIKSLKDSLMYDVKWERIYFKE